MTYLKMPGLAVMAAMALIAFGAGSASAQTTELFSGGTATTLSAPVTLSASLEPGSTTLTQSTSEVLTNTCTDGVLHGNTTQTTVSNGPVTGHFSLVVWGGPGGDQCDFRTVSLTHGSLSITNIGEHNGTVESSGMVWTVLVSNTDCLYGTGTGTHLGDLTGATDPNGHATLEIEAVINEQGTKKFLCPDTTVMSANFIVTTPTGLVTGS